MRRWRKVKPCNDRWPRSNVCRLSAGRWTWLRLTCLGHQRRLPAQLRLRCRQPLRRFVEKETHYGEALQVGENCAFIRPLGPLPLVVDTALRRFALDVSAGFGGLLAHLADVVGVYRDLVVGSQVLFRIHMSDTDVWVNVIASV